MDIVLVATAPVRVAAGDHQQTVWFLQVYLTALEEPGEQDDVPQLQVC